MNKHREILRYILTTGLSNRQIGRSLKVSHNTVGRLRKIAIDKKLEWQDINDIDDIELETKIHTERHRIETKQLPNWAVIHRELKLPHVTLQLLWEDYCLVNPDHAYSYSQFTHYYRQYVKKLDISMRQNHRAGETVFVDFAGRTVPYSDADTGKDEKAQIFVGIMGCSSYSFACAVKSQAVPFWIEAHNRMFEYFGGTPQVIVPDNLKSAVIRAGNEPVLNKTYLEMAKHYQVAIIPARVRRPKDKSKAELTVLLVYRWILARLRHSKFFSINEINVAIAELLEKLNQRPFKQLPGSRQSSFETLDKPLLRPLPDQLFEYAEWVAARKIGPDYHIRIFDHYYSVPHGLIGARVEARVTVDAIELFSQSKLVANHSRSLVKGGHTTLPEHQPKAHRLYSEQTPELIMKWAKSIGVAAEAVVQHQFDSKSHALLGVRSSSSLQRLAKEYGIEHFELACKRAQAIGSMTVKSVRSILQRGLESLSGENTPLQINLPLHQNVRGASYYSSEVK